MAQGNYFRQTSEGTVEVQLTQSERDRVCQVLGEAVDVLQTFWRSQDIRGVPLVLLLAGLRCLLWEGMLAGLSAADQALLPTLEAQLLAQGRGGMAEEAVCQP